MLAKGTFASHAPPRSPGLWWYGRADDAMDFVCKHQEISRWIEQWKNSWVEWMHLLLCIFSNQPASLQLIASWPLRKHWLHIMARMVMITKAWLLSLIWFERGIEIACDQLKLKKRQLTEKGGVREGAKILILIPMIKVLGNPTSPVVEVRFHCLLHKISKMWQIVTDWIAMMSWCHCIGCLVGLSVTGQWP